MGCVTCGDYCHHVYNETEQEMMQRAANVYAIWIKSFYRIKTKMRDMKAAVTVKDVSWD